MSNAQVGLVITIIVLIVIGAWPIAIIPLIALILMAKNNPPKNTKEESIETLKKENEELKRKLDEQFIENIITKTSNREGR